jgi:cysteine desulfuration protein SufE
LPEKLQQVVDMFQMFDPADRTDMLLGYADKFTDVPPAIATRPFARSHQIPQCESDAYVWAQKQADGTLNLYFAVENPSGISAKALAAILDKTLSGLPASEIATINTDIVEKIFRQNISMGKGMGLMSMVQAVQALAKAAAANP